MHQKAAQSRHRLKLGGKAGPRIADRKGRLKDHETPGMDARGNGRHSGIHIPVVRLPVAVQHDRHDQDHNVGRGRCGSAVERRPQSARGCAHARHALCRN